MKSPEEEKLCPIWTRESSFGWCQFKNLILKIAVTKGVNFQSLPRDILYFSCLSALFTKYFSMETETRTIFCGLQFNPGRLDGLPFKIKPDGPVVGFCGTVVFDPQTSLWIFPVKLHCSVELQEQFQRILEESSNNYYSPRLVPESLYHRNQQKIDEKIDKNQRN
jgi:hypothetical protein